MVNILILFSPVCVGVYSPGCMCVCVWYMHVSCFPRPTLGGYRMGLVASAPKSTQSVLPR